MMRILVAVCLAAACAACGGGKKTADAGPMDARLEGFDSPDVKCPGSPKCMTRGDGQLKVGAAKRIYTPQNFETYTDENMNRKWDSTEPYTDLNGNGKFDGVWLFGGARAAEGVKTDVEARAIAFVEGDITVVVVYVDAIGLLAGDMDKIRNHPMLAGLDIDHIIVGATHAHDAPDTVGLWGPTATSTGREDFIMNGLYDAAAAAIKDAVTNAQPAQMVIASTKLINDPSNPMSKTDDWNQDIRDPIIFDPTITIARFVKVSDPSSTIGTLVNWGDHPEVAHFDSSVPAMVTAHYPHWLREHVENGVLKAESKYAATDLAGLGGVTVFVQGALGGQIGSLRGTHPPGPEGSGAGSGTYPNVTMESHAMDQAIGTNAAARALTALNDSGESVSDLPLTVTSAKYNARIDNTYFHVAFLVKLIGPHDLVGYDSSQPIDENNLPWLPLRATYLQIGPLGLVTAPGELHPELWVGGYDGSWSWGWPLLNHTVDGSGNPEPNQPDFSKAPAGPYMRELVLAKPGVKYPVLAGLAEDYIGYIVPSYNYALDPDNPYIVEAKGDHYEEVYSLGPLVEQHAVHPILQLLQIP
ncbi:MAG: hypothetical protein JO257_13305 [Deltaproteobacteria bacterium]|nr:hypothetical protein [Deltaproteobacteria bacterium]